MHKRLDDSCDYYGPWRDSIGYAMVRFAVVNKRRLIEVHSKDQIRVDISMDTIDKLREDEWAYDSSKRGK